MGGVILGKISTLLVVEMIKELGVMHSLLVGMLVAIK